MISNLLTASRLKVARACKRKHRIRYELGYTPVFDAEELFFGTLIHLALEAWWLAVKAGLHPDEWQARALAALQSVRTDPFDLARAVVMVMGYDAKWSVDATLYEVLAVEVRFATQVINPDTGHPSKTWRLGGKLDVVLRERATGRILFMEHKTSGEDITPGSKYWKRLRMDGQVSIYFDGAKSLGFDCQACLYDVLAKPQQRPSQVSVLDEHGNKIVHDRAGQRVRTKTGQWRQTGSTEEGYVLQTRPETADEYRLRVAEVVTKAPNDFFQRGEVVRLEQELHDARFDIWSQAKELRENELAGRAQRNPDACDQFNRLCPYFDVCTGAASLDDPRLFLRTSNVHPELAGEPDASKRPKEVA